MRKSTKWFVYGIAILIIAAAILFVWVYPQLDRSAQQTIRDIQTGALADDTQTESPTVDDHTEADNGGVPTAAPEALAVGLRGVGETIHDTETMGEGSRDYTLNRVEVYDTIEDSPISLSECVPNTSYDTYQTWKFILLDMNVTNTSESEMEPRTGEEYQFMLDLIPRNEGDSQMLYFSAHPDSTNSASDYNKFNLAPGDTLNFQIGIFIEPSAWEEQSVYAAARRVSWPVHGLCEQLLLQSFCPRSAKRRKLFRQFDWLRNIVLPAARRLYSLFQFDLFLCFAATAGAWPLSVSALPPAGAG